MWQKLGSEEGLKPPRRSLVASTMDKETTSQGGKGQDSDSPEEIPHPPSLQKGEQLCPHPDFGPVRPILVRPLTETSENKFVF